MSKLLFLLLTAFCDKIADNIPFYIFSYEKEFDKMESDRERLEEVKRTYQSIMVRLDRRCISGVVNEYEKQGRTEDVARAAENAEYQKKLMEELGI